MNRYLLAIVFILCASQAYAWDVKVGKSTIDVKEECVVIDINAKTQVKVCKCGSVHVQEWKEVVKNKEDLTRFSTDDFTISVLPSSSPCFDIINGYVVEVPCK